MKKTFVIILLSACFYVQGQTSVSDKDLKFAKAAVDAGMMEVKLGRLAATKGATEDVRTLGQHMVDDHTNANNELMALASKKGISLPSDLSDMAQKTYDKLVKKQGEDFDRAYSKQMVKDHKKVIALFKQEAEKGSDIELVSFAKSTMPVLEHHLQMSKETCDKTK